MKRFILVSSMLAVSLAISAPNAVFAHIGHGDEFQATGGIQRVKVNAETDQIMGIVVSSIEQAAEGGTSVMIPVTAVVDADGKQLVFVQYEDFYEPVEVTTGTTKGDSIEVTQGLSVGEKLVTQGSLSLYAESRKTQPTDATASPAATTAASPEPLASPQPGTTHAQADAQGIPHSHDVDGNMNQQLGDASQASGVPTGILFVVGGGIVAGLAAIAFFLSGNRKKKSTLSDKEGGV